MTGCTLNCSRSIADLASVTWGQMAITATYTAETVFLIVNNQTNSTRTSTIKNTEINFADITPPTNTNSAGTVTTSIKFADGSTAIVYDTLRKVVNFD